MKLALVPNAAPWFSGIIFVLNAPLARKVSAKDVRPLFEEIYQDERLISIIRKITELKDIENNLRWVVWWFQVHIEGEWVVIMVNEI